MRYILSIYTMAFVSSLIAIGCDFDRYKFTDMSDSAVEPIIGDNADADTEAFDASKKTDSNSRDAAGDDDKTDAQTNDKECDAPKQLRCEGNALVQRVICNEDGLWVTTDSCPEGQLCDTQANESGSCRELAPQCEGRQPNEVFCDGENRVMWSRFG